MCQCPPAHQPVCRGRCQYWQLNRGPLPILASRPIVHRLVPGVPARHPHPYARPATAAQEKAGYPVHAVHPLPDRRVRWG